MSRHTYDTREEYALDLSEPLFAHVLTSTDCGASCTWCGKSAEDCAARPACKSLRRIR